MSNNWRIDREVSAHYVLSDKRAGGRQTVASIVKPREKITKVGNENVGHRKL